MLSAVLKDPFSTIDALGVSAETNGNGLALIHIDTEQAPVDHDKTVRTALRRAGLDDSEPPPWFLSVCLTGLGTRETFDALRLLMQSAAKRFGGIQSVLVDGHGDLIADVNDAAESNAAIHELQLLAIQYNCPIIGALHRNPGTDKSRGHLGSQFERKCETVLTFEKSDEIVEIWSEKCRHAPILKGAGPRFKWSVEAGMHVSVECGKVARKSAKMQSEWLAVEDVFHGHPAMRYSDLKATVATKLGLRPGSAENRITSWIKLGVVEKSAAGLYVPRSQQSE